MNTQESSTAAAFSKQSKHFDEEDLQNPVLQWMRAEVYKHLSAFLTPGSNLLELNCGTGIDAIHFAALGIQVYATDNAPGMLETLNEKILDKGLQQNIQTQLCSFNHLENITEQNFDQVFSNFGGLNCTNDLSSIITKLKPLLKKNAIVTWVVMPPLCPWEWLYALKGNFKLAFRRLKKQGVISHLENEAFTTYYFSLARLKKDFGKDFELIKVQGLGTLTPPPHAQKFYTRFPRIIKLLQRMDGRTAQIFPFNRMADHIIVSMRYKG